MERRPSSCTECSSVNFKDFVEELLKFVLESSINGTLEFNLDLYSAFCCGLLENDPTDPFADSKSGVPPYPLYKQLASGLWESLKSCTFCPKYDQMLMLNGDSFLKQKEKEWLKLIMDKGSEIIRVVEEEMADGILALCVSDVPFQPHISLASILSGLSYEGIQGLLGLTYTRGTVADVLPPPRSALLSSFMLPYKPEAKGIKLTHGAKALAKHSHRSGNKYWGTFDGSDSKKNSLAMNTIFNLIAHSCWLNIHIVAPHGVVFEIRVAEGYGARWSKDGTKFIGFLEPYMEDGHSKGWKH